MIKENKLIYSLFFLRASVFLVMFMWTVDKFVNPGHAAKVFEKFYHVPGLDSLIIYGVGIIEIVVLLMFFFGLMKTFTYGAVLAFHSVATLSAFSIYLSPFQGSNLLFFAAWPMLAACVMLFLFRNEDIMLQFGGNTKA